MQKTPRLRYVCHRKLNADYITRSQFESDRSAIRIWLIRSLLKASGIWGSGLDTLLTALREAISTHGNDAFPTDKIQDVMNRRGKSLAFTDEEIGELVEMPYGDKRLFAMLALLFPFVDVKNHFHIDHVFPQSRFTKTKLKKVGVADEDLADFEDMVNGLPNLQLLEGPENIAKLASLPAEWINTHFTSDSARQNFCERHLLGTVPESITQFRTFYDTRRDALRSRITKLVAATDTAST